MKYDKELYKMSKKFSKRVFGEKEAFECDILEYIKRKIIDKDYLDLDGVLCFTFKHGFDNEADYGLYEIINEVYNMNFIPKAREYCIYLADIKPFADEFGDVYVTLLWDYQTYFMNRYMTASSALDKTKKM